MGQPPRRGAVRVRQRSRTSLRAFVDPLRPDFTETAIDRLQVRVNGHWRASRASETALEYLDLLASLSPTVDGLRSPERRPPFGPGPHVKLQTRADPPHTISFTAGAQRRTADVVDVWIDFQCNPTRTLAHLLTRLRDGFEVPALVEMDCFAFFLRAADVMTTFGDQDNWVADFDAAHSALGGDIFTAFLPIYMLQLRRLAVEIVSPYINLAYREDGTDDILSGDGWELRLNWGNAKVPQVETYFERYHSGAREAVRAAANNVLTSSATAVVRHHIHNMGFERREDLFSIRSRMSGGRDLSIYAKTATRLRFEVARLKAGRYGPVPPDVQPGASARLLHILDHERHELLEACQWRVVGELFAEHGVPLLPDLITLIRLVDDACAEVGSPRQTLLATLLADGGITLNAADAPLLAALTRRGILERVSIRQRNRSRRYALTPFYRAVHAALLDTFSGSDPECG